MMFIIVYNQQINYEKDLVMYIVCYFVFFYGNNELWGIKLSPLILVISTQMISVKYQTFSVNSSYVL